MPIDKYQDPDINGKVFYLVWSPRGDNPRARHATETEAIQEADRLAKKYQGRHFYVLESVGYSKVDVDSTFHYASGVPEEIL